MQKHSILDGWRGSEYVYAQIAPGNVLCHHNKHLMGYFEFLHGSRIICLKWLRLDSNPVWPNGWVFVYELSGSGFESSCSHLTFRFHACFEQGVPWHSGNYREWIHSETRTWHDKNIQYNLPSFEIFRKIALTTCLWKARRGRVSSPFSLLIRYSTHTLKNSIYHSNKQTGITTIFSFGYQTCTLPHSGPFCWKNTCPDCNSGIDMDVVLEYTFFQLSSNT